MAVPSASSARGRAGPSWAGEAGRSQCRPLASPMTPIQRRYPRVIRVRGVGGSAISVAARVQEAHERRLDVVDVAGQRDELRRGAIEEQLGVVEDEQALGVALGLAHVV